MIVYLGHAKANYSSELDGYVLAARACDHRQMLHSFVYTDGVTLPGIKMQPPIDQLVAAIRTLLANAEFADGQGVILTQDAEAVEKLLEQFPK